ncbi:Lipopolysaccharide-binding protein [Holothuria leucospilota]|uniref:Lipopolysaccharide-binding protein n=1 Tax=Holothuria leucospilota TaxID=206669 RepID=A0A9Q1CBB3_HOLLE|nr:Lipopolysaccharide-binding protein [Holothuria leucospilota]
MVFLRMTDFVPKSACYVFHKTGFFQYNVTQDKIPSDIKISLNTSDSPVRWAIPQIANLYPNMMMQINLNTTAPPKLKFTSGKVGVTVKGGIAAYIAQPNKSLTYLFTLGATINVNASISFRKADLIWNSSFEGADLKLLHTEVDDFKVDYLRSMVPFACKMFIIPEINKRGKKGVPLPSFRDYAFVNPIVKLKKGLLKIGTGIRYQKNWLLDPNE